SGGQIWVGDSTNKAAAVTPSGDVSMTDAGAFTVTKIQGRAVDSDVAPVDGQFMKWVNGSSEWQAAYIGVGDLKKSDGTPQIPSSCSADKTLNWSSLTDTFTCTSIAIGDSAIT